MGRYIDADKLWDNRPQIPKGYNEKSVQGFERCLYAFSEQIRKQIDNPTADVVEVVRCKDCEYAKQNYLVNGLCLCEKIVFDGIKGEVPRNILMAEDDFCSQGKRKEERE